MPRLACVNLPAFPLQLLLRRHREWAAHPVAVVAEDKPQGLILWVNEPARSAGIFPGLRYAAAASLSRKLHVAAVPSTEIEKETMALLRRLTRFSHQVEPSREEPGVFWLSVVGLNLLHPSLPEWAHKIQADIQAEGFRNSLAVGWTRFGTYAVAKARQGIAVFNDPSEEHTATREIPLAALDLNPDLRETLFKLGIKTVGSLLALPPGGFGERFGREAYRLYQMASGEPWTALEPHEIENPVQQKVYLDDPETDVTRLLFLIKSSLHPMLNTLAAQSEALAELCMGVLVDKSGWRKERLRPAIPTLDAVQVLDLVRLRLETMQFSAGVVEIELTAGAVPATPEQLRLFAEQPARDLDAANRALARLRAELGDNSVVHAQLTDGHLPEARFTWAPLEHVKLPSPKSEGARTLVRRILAKPAPLASDPRSYDGWLLLGPKFGPVDKLAGPYVFSGGWWVREIHREYYFAETRRGALLWIYYDRVRRKWFLQGWVE
ncbi:MAG: DNA polymerase Y family protein [Candidatus Binatia bacterium]